MFSIYEFDHHFMPPNILYDFFSLIYYNTALDFLKKLVSNIFESHFFYGGFKMCGVISVA